MILCNENDLACREVSPDENGSRCCGELGVSRIEVGDLASGEPGVPSVSPSLFFFRFRNIFIVDRTKVGYGDLGIWEILK